MCSDYEPISRSNVKVIGEFIKNLCLEHIFSPYDPIWLILHGAFNQRVCSDFEVSRSNVKVIWDPTKLYVKVKQNSQKFFSSLCPLFKWGPLRVCMVIKFWKVIASHISITPHPHVLHFLLSVISTLLHR